MGIIQDLFGHETWVPDKTFEQEYQEYINSPEWKRKRKAKIDRLVVFARNVEYPSGRLSYRFTT